MTRTTNQTAKSKAAADAAIQKRLRERYSDPALRERGLEILAGERADGGHDREISALAVEFWDVEEKMSAIRPRLQQLTFAYEAIGKVHGYTNAGEWSIQSGLDALTGEHGDLAVRGTNLVDSMIKLQPKTLAGIAAVARAFKEDQSHFWKKPELDRDWEISLSRGSSTA